MKTVQFSAIIDGVTKKKDGTLSVKLGTQELSPEDTAHIFELGNKQIWTALAATSLTKNDIHIPDEVPEMNQKTKGQRLRAVIYRLWQREKANGKTTEESETFYQSYMEKIIEHIKTKLD